MDKNKERAEWLLALDLQERKLLDGMKEICSDMGDNLKSFRQTELGEIKKEMGNLKKGMKEMTQKLI